MGRMYVIAARDYWDAAKKLRRLRRRKAVLHEALLVVSVEDHRKIQHYLEKGRRITIIIIAED